MEGKMWRSSTYLRGVSRREYSEHEERQRDHGWEFFKTDEDMNSKMRATLKEK